MVDKIRYYIYSITLLTLEFVLCIPCDDESVTGLSPSLNRIKLPEVALLLIVGLRCFSMLSVKGLEPTNCHLQLYFIFILFFIFSRGNNGKLSIYLEYLSNRTNKKYL